MSKFIFKGKPITHMDIKRVIRIFTSEQEGEMLVSLFSGNELIHTEVINDPYVWRMIPFGFDGLCFSDDEVLGNYEIFKAIYDRHFKQETFEVSEFLIKNLFLGDGIHEATNSNKDQ